MQTQKIGVNSNQNKNLSFKGLIKTDLSKLSEETTTNILRDVYQYIGKGLMKDKNQDIFIGLSDKQPENIHRKTLMIATAEDDFLKTDIRAITHEYFNRLKGLLSKHLSEDEVQKRLSINKEGFENKAGIAAIREDSVTIAYNNPSGSGGCHTFDKNGKYKSEANWIGVSGKDDME